MRRFVLLVVLILSLAPPVRAGIVQFDPPTTEVSLSFLPSDGIFEVSVSVVADRGELNSLDIVFGSFDGLEFIDFQYAQELVDLSGYMAAPIPLGIYPDDLYVGMFAFDPIETPFVLGTLRISLLVGNAWGNPSDDRTFFVDSTRDGGFSSIGLGTETETLMGSGQFAIGVPEPTTAVLLLTASLALARRSRKVVHDVR